MIAPAKSVRRPLETASQRFEQMLPQIQLMASYAFRDKDPELREELAAEVVARAYVAFVRLAEQGRADIGYARPLAMYAVRQVKSGRRIGTKLNIRDVSSQHAQMAKKISMRRLDTYDRDEGTWREALVEDRRAGPAETAAIRIDFAAWLDSLSSKYRHMAAILAEGETTGAVARRFRVTPSRVSHIRKQLKQAWESFVGTAPDTCSHGVT